MSLSLRGRICLLLAKNVNGGVAGTAAEGPSTEDHIKNPYAAGSIQNPANFANKYRANEVCGQC